MTQSRSFSPKAALLAASFALALAGCSQRGTSELLNDSASTQTARANPDLTLPPDLRLPAPGSGPVDTTPASSYSVSKNTASTKMTKSYAASKAVSPITGAAQPQGDIYDQNGISKVNPDGTPKSKDQLNAELRKALLAKKREANPNYGTISNIGNIFSGG